MSDNYSKKSKSSSRHYKEKEPVRSKPRSKYSNHKNNEMESKTPPLPTKQTSTLEELIKKRDTLKQELKKIVKYADSESSKSYNRKRIHSREDYGADIKMKRSHKENERKSKGTSKIRSNHEPSPELDNAQIESEDEETIIQKRRQLRKELIEKFITIDQNNQDQDKSFKKTTDVNSTKKTEFHKVSKQTTDMFADKDEFELKPSADTVTQDNDPLNSNLADNWDDEDGYYKTKIGDVINNKYTIKGILGQGVFANVVRAQNNSDENDYVAIKIVRNNDLIYRTSLKEIAILNEIKQADPDKKYHCVQYLGYFMYKGHLCILLESLHMDLRAVIKKYGKHHGLNMKALVSYTRQLFLALRLLRKLGIIHADIKPDNILVNEKKNVLKLCDFGSAAKINENEPTPYLVSRFYRAPEIILGVTYKHGVDIWSAACTIFEMATGKILFTGSSNNKMLKCFMDLKGRFPSKFIRRGKFKDQHFNYNNNFLLHKKDEFTGREKVVEISNITPNRDLLMELNRSYKNATAQEEIKIAQVKDLLEKMTMLDSSQRVTVAECLKHPFIQDFHKDSMFI